MSSGGLGAPVFVTYVPIQIPPKSCTPNTIRLAINSKMVPGNGFSTRLCFPTLRMASHLTIPQWSVVVIQQEEHCRLRNIVALWGSGTQTYMYFLMSMWTNFSLLFLEKTWVELQLLHSSSSLGTRYIHTRLGAVTYFADTILPLATEISLQCVNPFIYIGT